MIVAVSNKECPLRNQHHNVRSAQMFATAMKSATLTIRADKFCFRYYRLFNEQKIEIDIWMNIEIE